MIKQEGQFSSRQGKTIAYRTWLPEGDIKAAILLVHGLGEHSGRYTNLASQLTPLGYAIYAVDHIGHGQSDGIRKYVDTFADFTDTLEDYLKQVQQWIGDKPMFLLGHSMGGLISACFLLSHQSCFSGAILSAPALKISDDVPRSKILIGKLLAIILPKTGIVPINPGKISRDPKVIEAYMNDELIHKGKTSARLAAELLKAMQEVRDNADAITLPMLILQGTADAIVNPAGAQAFYAAIASPDKSLRQYDGLYHEVFNEPEKAMVFDDLIQWLEAH